MLQIPGLYLNLELGNGDRATKTNFYIGSWIALAIAIATCVVQRIPDLLKLAGEGLGARAAKD